MQKRGGRRVSGSALVMVQKTIVHIMLAVQVWPDLVVAVRERAFQVQLSDITHFKVHADARHLGEGGCERRQYSRRSQPQVLRSEAQRMAAVDHAHKFVLPKQGAASRHPTPHGRPLKHPFALVTVAWRPAVPRAVSRSSSQPSRCPRYSCYCRALPYTDRKCAKTGWSRLGYELEPGSA